MPARLIITGGASRSRLVLKTGVVVKKSGAKVRPWDVCQMHDDPICRRTEERLVAIRIMSDVNVKQVNVNVPEVKHTMRRGCL